MKMNKTKRIDIDTKNRVIYWERESNHSFYVNITKHSEKRMINYLLHTNTGRDAFRPSTNVEGIIYLKF